MEKISLQAYKDPVFFKMLPELPEWTIKCFRKGSKQSFTIKY